VTTENWRTAWDLYSSARELPPSERSVFLNSIDTDPEVLQEVLLLLDQPEEPSPDAEHDHSAPLASFGMGRYAVVEYLGKGGVSEVYSARDQQLARIVALKFLLPGTLGSRSAERVLREAKTLSSLNHPNIVTVYEVIQSASGLAIVMELVQGSALRALCGTPLPEDRVVRLGQQIAQALAAAHTHGIVHRDIKPENILVRPDGYIKVVDFGLARQVATDDSTSAYGVAAGTLRYMSPEQVRGEPVSPPSDIFSLGLVLYELATGDHPFAGGSSIQTAYSIATTPVAPLANGTTRSISSRLEKLIITMLAKDPAGRPSAADVAQELGEILLLSGGLVSSQFRDRRRRFWLTVLAVCFIAITAAAWLVLDKRDTPEYADLKIQPLTSQWGWERSPALSPDGKSVAFTRSDSYNHPEQIYLKRRDTEHLTQLTSSEHRDRIASLVWSPDGERIAFKRTAQPYEHPGAIYSVSREGGNEYKILDLSNVNLSSSIDWSPDGTQLAYSDADPNPDQLAIYLSNLKTGQKQRLTSPPKGLWGDWDPKFSPDGSEVAFKRVTGYAADEIYITKLAGGPIRRVTTQADNISGHAWTADGKSLIVSCQRGSNIFSLWRFSTMARDQAPQRLVQGPANAITPVTNRKTNLTAWVNEFDDFNIYRVSAKGDSPPEKFIASTLSDTQAAYSPTSRIAFISDRSGSREIWISDPDRTVQNRVTNFNGAIIDDIQWSHDGRRLACHARTHWIPSVFTLNCSSQDMHCDAPSRLPSPGPAEVPSWSKDDRFLYFASDRTGRAEIYKQPIDGGQVVQITHNGGYASRESTDGRWLYFSKPQTQGVWRMALDSSAGKSASAEEIVFGRPYQPAFWALAGNEIVFIDRSLNTQPAAIRAYNVVTRRVRRILSLTPFFLDHNDTRVSVSPDLRWVLYSQIDELRSNVMLAESR
jgi:eukaryotic-like serine/threonine-protein kinase